MKSSKNTNPEYSVAVIILAGGSSSRLGKPKQLLHYQNETLIKHVIKTASSISAKVIIVVSGFLHEELVNEVESELVQLIRNPDWQKGMGSSIGAGIIALSNHPDFFKIDGALILLCDQPLINTKHLQQLIAQFYMGKRSMVVATGYAETQGVPAIFDKSLFKTLQNMPPEKGAQWLLKEHREIVSTVDFEGAAIDVDTEEDYQRLLALNKYKQP